MDKVTPQSRAPILKPYRGGLNATFGFVIPACAGRRRQGRMHPAKKKNRRDKRGGFPDVTEVREAGLTA
jgi:hypothetical protein